MSYQFRREDNGEIIEVGFLEAMNAKDGFLEINGILARRINIGDIRTKTTCDSDKPQRAIVSDALGFPEQSLAQFEQDRQANNLTGVEFARDPSCKEFVQVKFASELAKKRYMQYRGYTDQNSKNGSAVVVSASQIEQAKALVNRKFV